MASELAELLEELCLTQGLLAFVAGVDEDTISRIANGRACAPSTRWRIRWAGGLLRQVTDLGQGDSVVAQIIDQLGDTPDRADHVQVRKAFLRHLRSVVKSGQPPVCVWREWRAGSGLAAA